MSLFSEPLLSAILIWLAFFTPAVAYVGLNALFFTTKQIRNSLLISALAGLLLAVVIAVLSLFLEKFCGGIATRIIVCLISSFLLCAMNEPILRNFLHKKTVFFSIVLGITCVLVLTGLLTLLIPSILLVIYLIFSLKDMKRNLALPKTLLFTDYVGNKIKDKSAKASPSIPFASHPNVYVFFLEAMQSELAMRQLYESEEGTELCQFLRDHGLKVYDNAFSSTDWTLDSRINMFELRYTQKSSAFKETERTFLSPVLEVFKQNGYTVNIFDKHSFVFASYADQADFCWFLSAVPMRCKTFFQIATPLFSQSAFWRMFSYGINPSDPFHEIANEAHSSDCVSAMMESIKHVDKTKPCISIIHTGAQHASYFDADWIKKYNPYIWSDRYNRMYKNATETLKQFVLCIEQYDPEAVILATGDHGSHSLDFFRLDPDHRKEGNPDQFYQQESVANDYVFLDLFSVLMAIKWPYGKEPEDFSPAVINLFPYLFIALSKDEGLRRFLLPEVSRLTQNFKDFYLVAEKGHPLPHLIPWSEYTLPTVDKIADLIYAQKK